ncbi:lytic murein transglycosylase [Nocardia sp. NPDC048505]|uniref:lytic transglycosylase domain-containing protein n=1 Tax=unclassified Nocardia TaxID=2637762 RepID=UPI0033F29144
MRMYAPLTASALLVAGLVCTGSGTAPTGSADGVDTADNRPPVPDGDPAAVAARSVGLLPVVPESARDWREMIAGTPADPVPPPVLPGRSFALPPGGGALGIPEIALAAYRNAELTLASTQPGCGLSWNLLAGIGRIESGHASGGRTDDAGTTVTPILGPALDGTLPGNEVILTEDGSGVRALGPMQFLPGTWSHYAADGNGDGVRDPHNVYDAALAAGRYLCSGGLDLRDPAQESRAVLRYNHSMSYAAEVLGWSAAYRDGGTPSPVRFAESTPPVLVTSPPVAPEPLPPSPAEPPVAEVRTEPSAPVTITIPGLPPIPCGIFCTPQLPDQGAPQPDSTPPPAPPPGLVLPFGIVLPVPA